MESKKGKNNFLKKPGLCAVWLTERLSGWHRRWRGRLAAARPTACFSAAVRASVSSALALNAFPTTAGLSQRAPAMASSLSTDNHLEVHYISSTVTHWHLQGSKHHRKVSRDVKRASWFGQPIQLELGCLSHPRTISSEAAPAPVGQSGHGGWQQGGRSIKVRDRGLIRKMMSKSGSEPYLYRVRLWAICEGLGLSDWIYMKTLSLFTLYPPRPIPLVASFFSRAAWCLQEELEAQSSTSWTLWGGTTKSFQYLEESINWIMWGTAKGTGLLNQL